MEVARALVSGDSLLLLDADFRADEIGGLGIPSAAINQQGSERSQNFSANDLRRGAAGESTARIGLFTSGSSGLPKLVWHSVSSLARGVRVSPRHAEAVWGLAYSPTHIAGIQVYLQALANNCRLVDLYERSQAEILTTIEQEEITHLSATPSFYRLLVSDGGSLKKIRSVTLGGEPVDARLIERLRLFFPNARFHNVYASTEAGTLLIAQGDQFEISATLAGQLVIREGTLHVHRSLLGEFSTSTANSMPGESTPAIERQSAEKTAEDPEWYDTGDVVEILNECPLRFRIVARQRDWVNVGGIKVNPHEVESVLEEFPGIRRARVFGRANSITGNILAAELQCRGIAPTEAAVREHAAARLQPFKVPRLIHFVDSFGQTRTGKLARQ